MSGLEFRHCDWTMCHHPRCIVCYPEVKAELHAGAVIFYDYPPSKKAVEHITSLAAADYPASPTPRSGVPLDPTMRCTCSKPDCNLCWSDVLDEPSPDCTCWSCRQIYGGDAGLGAGSKPAPEGSTPSAPASDHTIYWPRLP